MEGYLQMIFRGLNIHLSKDLNIATQKKPVEHIKKTTISIIALLTYLHYSKDLSILILPECDCARMTYPGSCSQE